MEHHNYSFFGQKSGIILNSASLSDPFIYIRFLKKKDTGVWEKPSLKEGKNVKFNLLEIIQILSVFKVGKKKWSTVHKFGEDTTSINIENTGSGILVSTSGYMKPLKFPESKLFYDLLEHIYQEKIVNSTSNSLSNKDSSFIKKDYRREEKIPNNSKQNDNNLISHSGSEKKNYPASTSNAPMVTFNESDPKKWLADLKKEDDYYLIPGYVIRQSEKAINFNISGKKEIWIPISCIKSSDISSDDSKAVSLWVKEWFLNSKIDEIAQSIAN